MDAAPPSAGPFGGIPKPIPGRIEAEGYDLGEEWPRYFDTTPGNEQGVTVYRGDDVDIKVSSEGGSRDRMVGGRGWLAYTVDVEADGLYSIRVRVGSLFRDRTFHLGSMAAMLAGPLFVPQVEAWDQYRTLLITGVPLHAGIQVLRVLMGPNDFMDLQWIAIRP